MDILRSHGSYDNSADPISGRLIQLPGIDLLIKRVENDVRVLPVDQVSEFAVSRCLRRCDDEPFQAPRCKPFFIAGFFDHYDPATANRVKSGTLKENEISITI